MGKSKKFIPDYPRPPEAKKQPRWKQHITDSEPIYRIGQSIQVDDDDIKYTFE